MKRYSTIKFKYGWIGFCQTTINIYNVFRFWFNYINEVEFGLAFGGFVWPDKYGGRHRDLFCFSCYQFEKYHNWHIHLTLFYIELINITTNIK